MANLLVNLGQKLSEQQAFAINNSAPIHQVTKTGEMIKEVQDFGLYQFTMNHATDGASTYNFVFPDGSNTPPFNCEIVDASVQCRKTSGGGTVVVKKDTTAITDAMICAVLKTVVRAGTIDVAQSSLVAGTSAITITTVGATTWGLVTLVVRRI